MVWSDWLCYPNPRRYARLFFISLQLQAELHHFFPQSALSLGLSTDLSFHSNQPGDQTVFGFPAESSDFSRAKTACAPDHSPGIET